MEVCRRKLLNLMSRFSGWILEVENEIWNSTGSRGIWAAARGLGWVTRRLCMKWGISVSIQCWANSTHSKAARHVRIRSTMQQGHARRGQARSHSHAACVMQGAHAAWHPNWGLRVCLRLVCIDLILLQLSQLENYNSSKLSLFVSIQFYHKVVRWIVN